MCQSYLFSLSINFFPQPTFFHSVPFMDPETQTLLRLNQETNQIVKELLQIFQRKEKTLPSFNKQIKSFKKPWKFLVRKI